MREVAEIAYAIRTHRAGFEIEERESRVGAEISTEHSASSYGQPVVVLAGEAYSHADLVSRWPDYELIATDHEAIRAAQRAGYRLRYIPR
jgi:hypothetical protein